MRPGKIHKVRAAVEVEHRARFVAGNIAALQSDNVFLLAAGEAAAIAADSVHANPGETIRIPVRITANPGIAGAQLDIVFDDTALTLKSIERGDVLSVGSFTPNVNAKSVQWYYDQADVTRTTVYAGI